MRGTVMNKLGGCYELELNHLFLKQADKNNLNYHHSRQNQWNLWQNDSGLVLGFIIRRGMAIPYLTGIQKESLEKFYCQNPALVDEWVKKDIKYYFEVLKELLEEQKLQPTEEYQRSRKKRKNAQIEGQMSLKDFGII